MRHFGYNSQTMRSTFIPGLFLLALLSTQACRLDEVVQEALQAAVVVALDSLAEELTAERLTDADAYTERLQVYLEAHPMFYGAAVALLDETRTVTTSLYVYRSADGYLVLDLVQPEYDIDGQDWITMPLAANAGVWTPPYFDAGGGEIWMITRSVPILDSGNIIAIVTTDLPVDAPDQ